nr:hypothetical protein [uncultured Pseudodesulfovibrio sp.]
MFRYFDGTYRQNPPARVEHNGLIRKFADLTREQWNELGYNEAVPIDREPFTSYETRWSKSEDLLFREVVVSATVDDAAMLDAARKAKQQEICSRADAFILAVEGKYGLMERQTWEQQYAEAVAYRADPESCVPLLDVIAVHRGMDVATLAGHIVDNRAAWVLLAGAVVGQRLAYQDAQDAASTVAEVEAVEICYLESA